MTRTRTLALLAALLAAPAALAFEPTGEISFVASGVPGSGASFDGDRVVGPVVNMERLDSGSWSGTLGNRSMELLVSPTRLSGSGVSLALGRKEGLLTVEGLYFGQRVRLELDARKLTGRYGVCSFELKRHKDGPYIGDVGCQGRNGFPVSNKATFTMLGQAGEPAPPVPQLVLALLAVLPGAG